MEYQLIYGFLGFLSRIYEEKVAWTSLFLVIEWASEIMKR